MADNDYYIEVDMYIGDRYIGKRKVHADSIAGRYFQGNIFGAVTKATEMVREVEKTLSKKESEKDDAR